MKGDERFQSLEFILFVKEGGCSVPGCKNHAEAHHSVSKKWLAGSDLRCIGLCEYHHDEGHHVIGDWEKFQEKYGINFDEIIQRNIENFFKLHGFATRYKESHRKNRKPLVKKFRKAKPLSKTCNRF